MYQNAPQRAGVLQRACWATLAALLTLASAAPAAGPWSAPLRSGQLAVVQLPSRRPAGLPRRPRRLGAASGPGSACSPGRRPRADGSPLRVPFVVNKDKGEVIDVHFEAWQPSARQVAFRYDLEAARDVPLTMLMAGVNFEAHGSQGTLTLTHAEGKLTKLGLPVRGIRSAPATSQADLRLRQGRHHRHAARSALPPCLRQRHARGAGVRRVPQGQTPRDADLDLPRGRGLLRPAGRPRQVQPHAGRSRLVCLPAVEGGGSGRHRHGPLARPPRRQARRRPHGQGPLRLRRTARPSSSGA